MPVASRNQIERARLVAQANLANGIRVLTGEDLWTIQARIAEAVTGRRSKTAVSSCNASGKTWLAARLAVAFYVAFTPGTPCVLCDGPCGGSKVVTTSSKFEHLKDNLWGEIRQVVPKVEERLGIRIGRLLPGDLRLEDGPAHFIMGQAADKEEGFQGYHAAHKLIVGDEATAISEGVSRGITSLLASADSRLFLIFNPTTPDTYAANQFRSSGVEAFKIRAFDTPHFTGEAIPEDSNLITPEFLDELRSQGMGEGTYEWTTRVLADFWDLGDSTLIAHGWYDRCREIQPVYAGTRALGIDLAPYGSDENVIVERTGQAITGLKAYPAMRMDQLWRGPVRDYVERIQPHYVVYDADGVGAGAIGEADMIQDVMRDWGGQVLGFRGGLKQGDRFMNARSAWWWSLRRRFEYGAIQVQVNDEKLRKQILDIHYSIKPTGEIRVETKEEMKRRGVGSPDRADALMYACALADDLPMYETRRPSQAETVFGVSDRSEAAMWDKLLHPRRYANSKREYEVNPVLDCPDDF